MNLLIDDLKKGQWVFKERNGKIGAFLKSLKIIDIKNSNKISKDEFLSYDKDGKIVCFSMKKNQKIQNIISEKKAS